MQMQLRTSLQARLNTIHQFRQKVSLKVEKTASVYSASFEPTKGFAAQSQLFAEMHVAIM
jgi:hypothetical protein